MLRWLCLLNLFCGLSVSFGGQLGNFSDEVKEGGAPTRSTHTSSDEDDKDSWLNGFVNSLFFSKSSSAEPRETRHVTSMSDASGEKVSSASGVVGATPDYAHVIDPVDAAEPLFQHDPGAWGLPWVRFDYRWQSLDDRGFYANDYLLEAGYKAVAFYGRMTRYVDTSANECLNIDQYYLMLRSGMGVKHEGAFQIGLGAGGYVIKEDQSLDGFALTLPISFYPNEYIGVEIRPAWAKIKDRTVSDYDLSLSAGGRFVQLRAGYRWLWLQGNGHWLNGPYAGLSFAF